MVLPSHLDAVIEFAKRGLSMQERFSLKATIELLVRLRLKLTFLTCSFLATAPADRLRSANQDGIELVSNVRADRVSARHFATPSAHRRDRGQRAEVAPRASERFVAGAGDQVARADDTCSANFAGTRFELERLAQRSSDGRRQGAV